MTDWLMQIYPAFIVLFIASDDIITKLHVYSIRSRCVAKFISYYIISPTNNFILCFEGNLKKIKFTYYISQNQVIRNKIE